MIHPFALSPSGPIIGKGATPGPGASIRLTEATSVMGGPQAIPTMPDVIIPDGFGDPGALVLTLDAPKPDLHYRANLALDVINTSTNEGGEVVLYLDSTAARASRTTQCSRRVRRCIVAKRQ